ncbi:class I SAM-dependent methyltransferase [Haloprofundus salinisoli]|uniref:class I SAM-dependent methyltransferase n=1 Tax=Haloprofundus salinisoli TaxID=2876193 RepID=UPI001CD03069|nr:class I SAM-dependent methyltransferase [Haloprofundus salinisoli]
MWPPELEFVCGDCGSRLSRRRESRDGQCHSGWQVDDDGIVRLLDVDAAAEDSEEIHTLVAALRTEGMTAFKRAEKFESELQRIHPDFEYESWLNPDQADWLRIEPLAGKTVLELGSRYGALTRSLARRADHVVAVDTNLDGLRFSAAMREPAETENLTLVHGDAGALPFGDDQFDVVVINGVLKHVGADDRSDDPVRAQRSFLRRVRRWLRPGGRLLMSEWNRLDPVYRFTSLVPAAVETAVLDAGGRRHSSSVRLHSERGYVRLLERAGFRDVAVSYAVPNRRSPAFVFSDEQLLATFLRRKLVSLGSCVHGSVTPQSLSRVPFPPGTARLIGALTPAYKISADAP